MLRASPQGLAVMGRPCTPRACPHRAGGCATLCLQACVPACSPCPATTWLSLLSLALLLRRQVECSGGRGAAGVGHAVPASKRGAAGPVMTCIEMCATFTGLEAAATLVIKCWDVQGRERQRMAPSNM